MSHGKTDAEIIAKTRNTARYFVETRHIAWVVLIGTCIWGIYSYWQMPQRKDPEVPVRIAVALIPWAGASAENMEELVTKKAEEAVAGNTKVTKIESISRTGLSVIYIEIDENVRDRAKEFDDIKFRLDAIQGLPQGAGPINFIKDFGDTAALMLTVASPKTSETEIARRASEIERAIAQTRPENGGQRFTLVFNYPQSVSYGMIRTSVDMFVQYLEEKKIASDVRVMNGAGFVGIDGASSETDERILNHVSQFVLERLQAAEFHPDLWRPTVVRDPSETHAKLLAVAGDKYTYRELDEYTELLEKTLKTVPIVSKVQRSGVLPEAVYLLYSQERLAVYGVQSNIDDVVRAHNISQPGGQVNVAGKSVAIDPSGEFKNEDEIGNVLVPIKGGTPVYLRDLVTINRGYESPARFLNFFNWKDENGNWQRTRAITLAVQMRSGAQIDQFGKDVDASLNDLKQQLPEDLIYARTSDQPLQVKEKIELFTTSLWEAIILVVIVALIGFWEWRSAVLMALSIPLTLLMTFGMMHTLGIDIQQVSIATLIIALGLLVDDPVVAGDAIKRSLADGHPSLIAAWLGPTKLAKAILYATITNIVAYLPFLFLSGDMGNFVYSLPVVLTCSLVASRLVSMTFVPLLSYYLLKPKFEMPIEERRKKGFAAWYYKLGKLAIKYRWRTLAASLIFIVLGGVIGSQLKMQYTPKDLSYLFYIDVWLPEDAPLLASNETAERVERIVHETVAEYGKHNPDDDGNPRDILQSVTTFVGGGGPRFWFSVSPEMQQLNYAQIILQTKDKHDTEHLIDPLQKAISAQVPGARIDVRQLESGANIGIPVSIRLSGTDEQTLKDLAGQVTNILNGTGIAERVRDDWGAESFTLRLETDSERANFAGVTNLDVATASSDAVKGKMVTTLRDGDKQIPIVARLRMEERAQIADLKNLYVYSQQTGQKIPLQQVSSTRYEMETSKIRSRNQFRTITVAAVPVEGRVGSEVMSAARVKLMELKESLPPGYHLEIGGEEEEQIKGFKNQVMVLVISSTAIFLALVFQFQNAIKPFIVFAAVPYGVVGALIGLWVTNTPFGFMAFLGIISLIGVIVSHIIVLFDFIEEKHEEGEPLVNALLDAGIMRLRPVMITVGATVVALFPLAAHGGPFWVSMCYAQIGGLIAATVITLLLVPVLYAIFVLDLKLVKWENLGSIEPDTSEPDDFDD